MMMHRGLVQVGQIKDCSKEAEQELKAKLVAPQERRRFKYYPSASVTGRSRV
jgi:hypothetical protein